MTNGEAAFLMAFLRTMENTGASFAVCIFGFGTLGFWRVRGVDARGRTHSNHTHTDTRLPHSEIGKKSEKEKEKEGEGV